MNTVQYKCPNCGAELTFDPAHQNFSCEYCNSTYTEAEMQALYQQMEQQAKADADPGADTLENERDEKAFEEGTRLYTCQNCGAQIIAEAETSATFCYYCHAPVVLAGRLSGEYCPAYVLPFALTREDALDKFHKWCKKRWFLPKSFTSEKQLEKMSGVYVPFWVTNCQADSYVGGIAKRVRSWREGDYRITETQEYQVERAAVIPYRGVPADGSQKIEDALMDAIEPFPYGKMKPFSMQYLSGFMAQKYDVTYEQVLPRVKQRVEEASVSLLRDDIKGYSSVALTQKRAVLQNVQHDYVLLPVWFMHYQYQGKNFNFAINGQTGTQAGTPPLSVTKALIFSGVLAVVVMLISLLLGGILFR
ncbi:MAG: hypothetical protein ACI4XB_05845 [Ruminococcus sp.]